jgi:putative toxin-antitoxin system antitoxin component (TIGR02293 family)
MDSQRMRRVTKVTGSTEREPRSRPEAAGRLSIALAGRLSIRFQSRSIEFRTRKAAAVFSYLALTEAKQESRERLIGLLWSRSDEEKARASLRQVVRELRSILEELGYRGFDADRLSLYFDASNVDIDVENVVSLAESGTVHPALLDTPAFDERILEGMEDIDPSFRVWILAKRQTIHEKLMRCLEANLFAKDAAVETKKRTAVAIVNLDPTHEHACRHLMRLHAAEGDIAGALRIYKSLWDLLDRDYGMEPSPATEELVAQIKLGVFDPKFGNTHRDTITPANDIGKTTQSITDTRAPAKTRLVLRPFVTFGVDGDHALLIQGFHQRLAAALVRLQWSVVDRTSDPSEYQLSDSTPQYCIETTAHQAGEEINVVMVLRDEVTGVYSWSESFRLDPSNWFEAQRRIIKRIATSLNVELSAERLMRLAGDRGEARDMSDTREQNLIDGLASGSWKKLALLLDAIRENPTPATERLVANINPKTFQPASLAVEAAVVPVAPSSNKTQHLLTMPEETPPQSENERLRHIADLLGGPKVVGKYPADSLATHEMLERGLPNTAIKYLLEGMTTLTQKSVESAIGMSVRTLQRREKHPTELLSQDQAGRTWKFAEILTRATLALGSKAAAEEWLAQPATGLDQRRPIDLLTTPAGVELVEDFLGRMEYGVYT